MKRKNTTKWIVEVKGIKVRQQFAPLTRKFLDKTKYCRRLMRAYLD